MVNTRITRSNSKNVGTDNINDRMDQMSALFQQEMDKFKQELTSNRCGDSTTGAEAVATDDSLLTRFTNFQAYIEKEVHTLREQVRSLQNSLKQTEHHFEKGLQNSYRTRLLLYGVSESESESSDVLLDKIITGVNNYTQHKNVKISTADISDCYRQGRKCTDKTRPRPVCVDFVQVIKRNLIYNSKSAFKGSKIVAAEFLTKSRYALLREAKKRYGKDCWTRNGTIYINTNGAKRIIREMSDFDN